MQTHAGYTKPCWTQLLRRPPWRPGRSRRPERSRRRPPRAGAGL